MLHTRSLIGFLLCSIATTAFGVQERSTATELFAFLVNERNETRLGTQPELLSKFLSPQLVAYSKVIECESARANNEDPHPTTTVDAELIFDRWDTPSQCSASKPVEKSGQRIATISCRWGKGKDHPEGATLQLFAHMQNDHGSWKVYNVVHGKQEPPGGTTTDLVTRMRSAMKQSANPEICAQRVKGQ
ncbi:MAG: hypothetical protein RLY58_793 [Pseudomonadota bacterium]|jgi:hypothetical protein